jgi:hypothetical protein
MMIGFDMIEPSRRFPAAEEDSRQKSQDLPDQLEANRRVDRQEPTRMQNDACAGQQGKP